MPLYRRKAGVRWDGLAFDVICNVVTGGFYPSVMLQYSYSDCSVRGASFDWELRMTEEVLRQGAQDDRRGPSTGSSG